jgi:hypothetical protein
MNTLKTVAIALLVCLAYHLILAMIYSAEGRSTIRYSFQGHDGYGWMLDQHKGNVWYIGPSTQGKLQRMSRVD